MDQRTQLRLEALRLAEGCFGGGLGPDHVVNCANRFYQFLIGDEEKRNDADQPEDLMEDILLDDLIGSMDKTRTPSFDDGLAVPNPAYDELRDYAEGDVTLADILAPHLPKPFNPNAAAAQTEERFDILGDPRDKKGYILFERNVPVGYWNI